MRNENEEAVARHQAARVERYWRDQGYLVKAWVEPFCPRDVADQLIRGTFWAIRSDLPVGGHPTRRIEE